MSTLVDNLTASLESGKEYTIPEGTKPETIARAVEHVNTQKIFGDINQTEYKKIMGQLQSFKGGRRSSSRSSRRSSSRSSRRSSRKYKNKR
jgi:hypothetical protein